MLGHLPGLELHLVQAMSRLHLHLEMLQEVLEMWARRGQQAGLAQG